MDTLLFALCITSIGGIGGIIIDVIIIAACIAVLYDMYGVFGIRIPPWVVRIFWICLAAAIGIIAIRFILSL